MSASAKVTCTIVYTLAPCAYTDRILAFHFLPVSPFRNESLAASQTLRYTYILVTVLLCVHAHACTYQRWKTLQDRNTGISAVRLRSIN